MARIINHGKYKGSISGRVGDVIFVQSKNGPYIRKVNQKKQNEPTSAKLIGIRQRFAMANSFLKRAIPIIKLGFWSKQGFAFQLAIGVLLKNAIVKLEEHWFIDYRKLQLSKGSLKPPKGLRLENSSKNQMTLYFPVQRNPKKSKELILACYDPINTSWCYFATTAWNTGQLTVQLSAKVQVLECYAFFRKVDGSNASDSTYIGSTSLNDSKKSYSF